MSWLDEVKWDANGLVPAIAQEVGSNDVLMLAFMNREALAKTAELGEAHYWSRSRGRLWKKGEESGNVQKVKELRLDCDNDVVLLKVEQAGAAPGEPDDRLPHRPPLVLLPALRAGGLACGRAGLERSRADLQIACAAMTEHDRPGNDDTLARLAGVIAARRGADPATSYVARLVAKGPDAVLKKIGEEATEVVMACKDGDPKRIVAEVADLWFHTMIALGEHGLAPADVIAELERREGRSGLEEFAARKLTSRETGWNMNDIAMCRTPD